jgi:hypothetical protein
MSNRTHKRKHIEDEIEIRGTPIFGKADNSNQDYDEYNDPRFIALDMNTIRRFLSLYERDSDIQTFSRATMNHALAGGILFTRKNKTLEEASSDWHNQTWSGWVRELYKMDFAIGFCIASFIPDDVYGAAPTVLSMDHVEVRYHLDAHNIPYFRVWENMDAIDVITGGMGGSVFGKRRIENVRFWSSSPPTQSGVFRSQLMTLMSDLIYETHLMQAAMIADQARSRPPIVSQRIPQAYRGSSLAGSGSIPTQSSSDSRYGDGNAPYRSRSNQHNLVELMNAFDSDSLDSMTARVDKMLSSKVNNGAVEQVYLEDGRQLVQQILPEPPHAILLGFRQSRAVRVGLMFGLTLPALTQPPRGVNISEVKKSGAHGKDDDGSNSVYFENFQRELKQRLIVYIHQMYAFIHTAPFAVEAMKRTKDLDQETLRQDVSVSVTLPGMPEESVLTRLFMGGILKYEAFVNYISSKHSIPVDAFETKPTLTLKEVNGIVEPKAPVK